MAAALQARDLLEEFGRGDARECEESWRYSKTALRALSQQEFIAADTQALLPDALRARFDWPQTQGRRVVFVNGAFSETHSDVTQIGAAVTVGESAGNTYSIRIDGDIDEPVHVIYVSVPSAQPSRWQVNVAVAMVSGRACVVEQYLGADGAGVLGSVRRRIDLADATRLKQVLANLLSNAIKYNTRAGSVTISAAPGAGDRVVITVTDTGQGMSATQLTELFQPFNRLGRESGPVPGTGIGLVVTKKLVELMNGTIEVSSVEAQGSTFSISLPAAHTGAALNPQSGRPSESAARYGSRRVAYFEDNPLNAEVMRAVLSARPQVKLDIYTRAVEGLAAIRNEAVDLLLMDMSLPDARGIDVLRSLKGDASMMRTPVIIVSADSVAEHVREALRNGAMAYIVKPIERVRVLEQIDRALASPPG